MLIVKFQKWHVSALYFGLFMIIESKISIVIIFFNLHM